MMHRTRPGNNPLTILLAGMLLALLSACDGGGQEEWIETVRETGKLELAEAEEEQTFVIRDKEWADIKTLEEGLTHLSELLKPGDRIGVYSFRSYAIAYVDLSLLRDDDIRLDRERRLLRITLPAIVVESPGRSATLNVLHERVSGSKARITPAEKKALQDRASALFLEQLKPGTPLYEDLEERAKEKASAFFGALARANGYEGAEIFFSSGL